MKIDKEKATGIFVAFVTMALQLFMYACLAYTLYALGLWLFWDDASAISLAGTLVALGGAVSIIYGYNRFDPES